MVSQAGWADGRKRTSAGRRHRRCFSVSQRWFYLQVGAYSGDSFRIDYVSKQRSCYGSYQNALEHLYAANAVTGENVSALESLLSDADMADEMVSFSRDNILE